MRDLVIRWTIGDVSDLGFEALRLSAWGAYRLFGAAASYVVCFNTVSREVARQCTGELPGEVEWRDVGGEVPELVRERMDESMAEGVGWKLAPLRTAPDRLELALDNDCILWDVPSALAAWLADGRAEACLLAADVRACFGVFADLCGPEPRNAGIRGFGPGFDFEGALRRILAARPGMVRSELDEQGLQVAAMSCAAATHVVSTRDVTICSPFPPHQAHLGRCGAHFVGLNSRSLGWFENGRPAEDRTRDHFARHRPTLYAKVGL